MSVSGRQKSGSRNYYNESVSFLDPNTDNMDMDQFMGVETDIKGGRNFLLFLLTFVYILITTVFLHTF